ncbi:MAG: methyltransferase domain-containing protein, partial [bacterium]|nr:methyltransferase domain-containing protein [bacterium]
AHFKNMAESVCKEYAIPKNSLAVDIGSNVGSLLAFFKDEGLRVLGVDPAETVARTAIENGIPTIIDFFSSDVAEDIVAQHGKAHIITGTNVFAHLHEIDDAVEGMKKLLADDGVIVIEAPYVIDLIEQMAYDTIYHQHVGYLSVKPMKLYFHRLGLELFQLKKSVSHGGSLQYYVGHVGRHPVSEDIARHVEEENTYGLYSTERLTKFASDVEKQKRDLLELLMKLKKEGKRIAAISTPAKGNTLLNYCHIDNTLLDFATEKNSLKVGRFTPGTHIPIYDDSKLLAEQPDYALILAWNFAPEIMNNLSEFKKRGGKFIIPVPRPTIVDDIIENLFKNYAIKPAFSDERGDIFDIVEEGISHVGLITFKKGAVRGNHYHKQSTQYTYILEGEIQFVTSDIDGKNKKEFVLTEGMVTHIPPHTVHAYKALTPAAMLDMTTLSRGATGYEEDTVRVSILK